MANAITFGTAAARAFGFTSKPSTGGASPSYTFTTSTQNATLNITSIGGYVAGNSRVTVTVNSGVYLWASTTSNYGLTLTGGSGGDSLYLVNNGYIIGCGGKGGGATGPAYSGGPALSFAWPINITNNSYIAAGGGGGSTVFNSSNIAGGGGAGGGAGGDWGNAGGQVGGTGGAIGAAGGTGTICGCGPTGGGGGGRILPGVGGIGAVNGFGGNGGGAGGGGSSGNGAGPSGNGGSGNAAGGNGTGTSGSGGGGGWGALGGLGYNQSNTSSGGAALTCNGNNFTFITKGNTWGYVIL